MSRPCNGDPHPLARPGIGSHTLLFNTVRCPGCDTTGVAYENSWGHSPPHGWWIAKNGRAYCSSECIAFVSRGPRR